MDQEYDICLQHTVSISSAMSLLPLTLGHYDTYLKPKVVDNKLKLGLGLGNLTAGAPLSVGIYNLILA